MIIITTDINTISFPPFEIVNAGDHWSRRISRQIEPLALMLGWYILVVKLTLGGLKG